MVFVLSGCERGFRSRLEFRRVIDARVWFGRAAVLKVGGEFVSGV